LKHSKIVIFSDLDGTLLDNKYDFSFANVVLASLAKFNVELIICSSKTRDEIEYYRKKWKNNSPFISENGAAIFIPKKYFKLKSAFTKQDEDYRIIEFGVSYESIRSKLARLRQTSDCYVTGFGDLTLEETAKETGLPIELAKLAKKREYTEPVIVKGKCMKTFVDFLNNEKLCCIKGDAYLHLTGCHNKGKAVSALVALMQAEFGLVRTIGVGNGLNDIAMLRAVDDSFFIVNQVDIQMVWFEVLKLVKRINEDVV
jgi:mannosyl-3-phosphoglycerate phosphatase